MADIELKPPEDVVTHKETHHQEERILDKEGVNNEQFKFKVTVPEGKKYKLTVVATLAVED